MPGRSRSVVRSLLAAGRFDEAWRPLRPVLLGEEDPSAWSIARGVLGAGARDDWKPAGRREARVAVLSTYSSTELVDHLEIACRVLGIDVELYAAPYGQVEQEVLAADTELSRFRPTHVLIAPTTADLPFPPIAADAAAEVAAEEWRWRALWRGVAENASARVAAARVRRPGGDVARPPCPAHAGEPDRARAGAERAARRRRPARACCSSTASGSPRGSGSDLARPAALVRRAPALRLRGSGALALETAAVLAADLGLGARCLVVDLDNTLWGGVLGEEGPQGIELAEGPDGEAFVAFQDHLLALKQRGVVLAVASKNDADVAREAFRNPKMRLRLDDFAAFVADWRPKSEQIAEIAETLGLGLDAIVFVDDNPAECAEVAGALPLVDTVPLGDSPSDYVRVLNRNVRFEPSSLTDDDLARQRSYPGRAQAEERARPRALEDFLRSLEMRARVRPLEPSTLDRAAQLTQKTNQFNLTLVRRTREEIEALVADPRVICLTLELEDRFAAHGIVGLALRAPRSGRSADGVIDTLLLSCRVIGAHGRGASSAHVARAARDRRLPAPAGDVHGGATQRARRRSLPPALVSGRR